MWDGRMRSLDADFMALNHPRKLPHLIVDCVHRVGLLAFGGISGSDEYL